MDVGKILTALKDLWSPENVFQDKFEVRTSPYGTQSVSTIDVLMDDEMMEIIKRVGSPQPERSVSDSESRSERGGGAPRTDRKSPKPEPEAGPETSE